MFLVNLWHLQFWYCVLAGFCQVWLFPSFSHCWLFLSSPSAPTQSVHDVCDNIENMMLARKYLVACGDFNIDMSDICKPLSNSFQQFITSHSLIQPICTPTRYTKPLASILDLFLTTPDVPIDILKVCDETAFPNIRVLLQLAQMFPIT